MGGSLESEIARRARIAAELAHDLRGPMNAIRLTAGLMARDKYDASRRVDHAGAILRGVDALAALAAELDALAEGDPAARPLERTREELRPLLESLWPDLRWGGEAVDGCCIEVERARCTAALSTLWQVAQSRSEVATVQAVVEAKHVRIEFRDCGPTPETEELAQWFKPFGLDPLAPARSLARRELEAHGGRLRVSAAADGGAVVEVTLPLSSS